MRAPSLYTHFASKNAIYDAMFADAWTQYLAGARKRRSRVRECACRICGESARAFFDFATADLARHQLMNQRTIPGFEPSPESYAPAVQCWTVSARSWLTSGSRKEEDVDLCTAMIGGLDRLSSSPMTPAETAGAASSTGWSTCSPTTWACRPTTPRNHHEHRPDHQDRRHERACSTVLSPCASRRRSTTGSSHCCKDSLRNSGPPRPTAPAGTCGRWPVTCSEWHRWLLRSGSWYASSWRQAKRQKRDGGLSIDALTAVQVDKNAGLSTAELVEAMRATGPECRPQAAAYAGSRPEPHPARGTRRRRGRRSSGPSDFSWTRS